MIELVEYHCTIDECHGYVGHVVDFQKVFIDLRLFGLLDTYSQFPSAYGAAFCRHVDAVHFDMLWFPSVVRRIEYIVHLVLAQAQQGKAVSMG